MQGDTVVSTCSNYTFTVVTNLSLVANLSLGSPLLTIKRMDDQLVIRWDTAFANYQLEYSTSAAPPQIWSPLPPALAPAAGACSVTNPITGDVMFFRLRLP